MGIFKTLSVSHKRQANGNYVICLQKSLPASQPCLIFEAGTIVQLDTDKSRSYSGFTKFLDGYVSLGMLHYAYEGCKELSFLIIVTGCVSVGKILNSEIYSITDVVLLSMRNEPEDQHYVSNVKKFISSGSFYFSRSTVTDQDPYDLTLTAQKIHLRSSTDNRFFWNRLLFKQFERFNIDTSSWLVKVLCGGINISTVYIGGLQAKACIISRLSCERAGTRFNVRGANDFGHVANFVETEQVIFINQMIYSFLTIRGSIPLFWEQPGVQVGSHRIKMSRGSEVSQAAYDKHMFLLKQRYNEVVLINLLSSRESEISLNQSFNAHHKASRTGSELPFINFDYHALCPKGNKKNLDKLYSIELDKYLEQFGYFQAEKGEASRLQQGVVRVNCLDCLDRTNSIQTSIGLKMIAKMVSSMVDKVDVEKIQLRLHDAYANLWVQNGDQISRIYTGTGALEGKNLLKDGTLSVARTIQNNLLDSGKQSAIDILVTDGMLYHEYSWKAASILPHYQTFASSDLLVKMCESYLDFCTVEKLKIAVATWNVNGGRHFDHIMYNRARPVSDWLVDYRSNVISSSHAPEQDSSSNPIDIYAIGFQEIVDLNASNIVASSTQNQRDWISEIQSTISRHHKYLLVNSVQLVGVCLLVFVRRPLAIHIRDVCMDQVKTGLGGATGNKGAVAVRFRYKATSICFISAHFAAGQHQVKERNDDYAEIAKRIQFAMGRSIISHDYVFWCGDFNYRLDKISNEEARKAACQGDYELLLAHDQLKASQAAGHIFSGYIEGDINFAPTYKYDTNSTDYDTGEKCRMPAYTDRILFRKLTATRKGEHLTEPNQIKFYNRIELLSSDHRPVIGEFEIESVEVDRQARADILDTVFRTFGPLDSTLTVNIEGVTALGEEQIAAIRDHLAQEVGDIALVLPSKSSLMVLFKNGSSVLKALESNGKKLETSPPIKLAMEPKTHNWQQVIKDYLASNRDNTTNLVNGQDPEVHFDDDEDKVAQEFDDHIDPELDLDSISLVHEAFMTNDQPISNVEPAKEVTDFRALANASTPPPVPQPPKSPRNGPFRPPPPSKTVAKNIEETSLGFGLLATNDDDSDEASLPPPTSAAPVLPPSIPPHLDRSLQQTTAPPPIPSRNNPAPESDI